MSSAGYLEPEPILNAIDSTVPPPVRLAIPVEISSRYGDFAVPRKRGCGWLKGTLCVKLNESWKAERTGQKQTAS
jgi:hypothetical protein